jgi:hypothetical protein
LMASLAPMVEPKLLGDRTAGFGPPPHTAPWFRDA